MSQDTQLLATQLHHSARGDYIHAQALWLALHYLSNQEQPEQRNIDDMRLLLNRPQYRCYVPIFEQTYNQEAFNYAHFTTD